MLIFGAWGKTGINCFVLITGYYMCKSKATIEKLMKLYLQITFYALVIYVIFCITGQEEFSVISLVSTLWPIKGIASNFVSCFLIFYTFIPILNIIVRSLSKEQHKYLLILLVLFFSIIPTIPKISLTFNYVTWFIALYIIASYIRFYGFFPMVAHQQWGVISIALLTVGALSVSLIAFFYFKGFIGNFSPCRFVADSNAVIALSLSVASFMYFKDLSIPHSRIINLLGGATFGVLLIHANSDTMRQWLWRETIDPVGHFGNSLFYSLGYAIVSVLIIFVICAGIDWFRGHYIEPHYMRFVMNRYKDVDTSIKKKYQL